MSEALIAITDWALSRRDVKLVLAETKEENIASQQILKKSRISVVQAGTGHVLLEEGMIEAIRLNYSVTSCLLPTLLIDVFRPKRTTGLALISAMAVL
jgi:hypothetical protein